MERIIIEKQENKKSRVRRATVVVKPEIYKRITDLALDTNRPIEDITNILLENALQIVEVQ